MAQLDTTIVIQPSNTTIRVDVPNGQGSLNSPADFPFVDSGTAIIDGTGSLVKPVSTTIAGNVRFANPS